MYDRETGRCIFQIVKNDGTTNEIERDWKIFNVVGLDDYIDELRELIKASALDDSSCPSA